jgi:hypothetical protein
MIGFDDITSLFLIVRLLLLIVPLCLCCFASIVLFVDVGTPSYRSSSFPSLSQYVLAKYKDSSSHESCKQ